ncbi:MAG: DUF3828 domain-containing protein [Dysgonamonadaceae bacterium]|jgi:hypothetical protein|nr:DUF3828 domain-containing protein [Dysgonamonadaceae bacterium]
MKSLKIYLLLFLYFTLFLSAVHCEEPAVQEIIVEQEAIHAIKDFYMAYTTNIISEISSNDLLIKKFLTKRLIERVNRIRTATGSDPVIRAQDFREDAIETLRVKHLEENWYMVSYDWIIDEKVNQTNIPLRVVKTDVHYKIDYITPEWNGSLYGDTLLYNHLEPQEIDASTPMSLLKTFYKAYTMTYCSMPEDLNLRLAVLRSEHFTSNALAQFEEIANEYEQDGYINYDLLIDYFDFDRLWFPSIQFTQLKKDAYQICYMRGEILCTIIFKIVKQDNEYRIDSITSCRARRDVYQSSLFSDSSISLK